MTEQVQQLQDSIALIRNRHKNLNKKISIIRSHIENNTMFKAKGITDIIKELCEFSKVQEKCAENYKILFNETLSDNEKLVNIEDKITEYNNEILKKETGDIVKKFKTIYSDVTECQSIIDKYAVELENIDITKMNLDEYKSAVSDYIKFYSLIESDNITDKIAFSADTTVFSEESDLLLKLIQGKITINQT